MSTSGWADAHGRLVLLTPEDARHLRFTDAEWKPPPRLRSASGGPLIAVRSPAPKATGDGPVVETKTPADLVIDFQPNRSPVDMNTLEVTARKGLFSKSLTEMLKPFVRGTALQVSHAEIPAGKFLIEIAIADTAGATTVETYRLQVEE